MTVPRKHHLPVIPDKVQDWNIDIIDSLVPILSIESETFDFKGRRFNEKDDELYNDICAMANTSGGHIVLGIGEDKTPDGTRIIRFTKEGFAEGEEDKVNQRITDNVYNVEPTPSVEYANPPIYETDGKTFYALIKINPVSIHKPYFTKNREQCYVRIGNSSRPASRTTILNLFSDYRERTISVQELKIAATFAKESLISISGDLEYNTSRIIPPIDLQSLKNAVSSNEWLLSQKGLLGGHTGSNHKRQVVGAYYHLRELDRLNRYLDQYNTATRSAVRIHTREYLCEDQYWCCGRQKAEETIGFLDGLINCAQEYLDKEM
jgi:hypothetical protein